MKSLFAALLLTPSLATTAPAQSANMNTVMQDYAAFQRGDIPAIIATFAEECTWTHVGSKVLPFAGTFKGHTGLAQFFGAVGQTLQVTRFEPHNYRENGNTIANETTIEAIVLPTGKPCKSEMTFTWKFNDAGKVVSWEANGDVSDIEKAFEPHYLSLARSATATPDVYDGAVAKMKAAGVWDFGWTFHALGAMQPAGLMSVGLFPDKPTAEARIAKSDAVFKSNNIPAPAPEVFEVYSLAVAKSPAKPATGILVLFDAKGMTTAQYDQIVENFAALGIPQLPAGQIFHAAIKTPDGLKVVDVWESAEHFKAFGEHLMPVLQKVGVNPGTPIIYILHNLVAM